MLHILPACLLLFSKPLIFLLRRFIDYLHKSGPLGVDITGKIVALVVWIVVDLIVNHESMALRDPSKDLGSLKHVDVNMRTGHAKKRVSNLSIL
jgi:hypothetical protein